MSQVKTVGNDGEPRSSQTLRGLSSPPPESRGKLDLGRLPPIFVSATHFDADDLHELKEELVNSGANLTKNLSEAKLVLSKVQKKRRVAFDLRAKGLWTEEVEPRQMGIRTEPPDKKRKLESKESVAEEIGKSQAAAIVIDDESTEDEAETHARGKPEEKAICGLWNGATRDSARAPSPEVELKAANDIKVVRVSWFEDSRKANKLLPVDDYLTYQCRRIDRSADVAPENVNPVSMAKAGQPKMRTDNSILERAKEDAINVPSSFDRYGKRHFGHHQPAYADSSWSAGPGKSSQNAHLLHQTTSDGDYDSPNELPEMPDWVKSGVKYACQRSTPANSPNAAFIDLLKKIRRARLLTNDEIGVRAYSTSIASLAAYPYKLSHAQEIIALPGCDAKIANLYVEWANTGKLQAVEDLEKDGNLQVLQLFYDIWGVGASTAREFYFDRGWKDLDDVVEFGWSTLSRVQQIGVKYYEEFLEPIPRAEVAAIGRVIHRHAVRVRDSGIQSLVVGGYRRGKAASGDVDIVISHPDERQTLNVVNDIVASLEDEGWITHTLLLSLHSSHRNQQTRPFIGGGGGSGSGSGGGYSFDTLDKALVVWQDPHWPSQAANLAADPQAKNPHIHRRVDIIISPWRTVGCAVVGWSGGTTFQRDLRRYAKNVQGWKFDSSGVRDRGNGEVVDVEGFYRYQGAIGHTGRGEEGRARTMEEAERRVFEGFGLVYREPWERCTG